MRPAGYYPTGEKSLTSLISQRRPATEREFSTLDRQVGIHADTSDRNSLSITPMPITKLWTRYGENLLQSPRITLGAYLGDGEFVAQAKSRGVLYPTECDLSGERGYCPNRHNLPLDPGYVSACFLVHCVATWGLLPLMRIAKTCSGIHCETRTPAKQLHRNVRTSAADVVDCLSRGTNQYNMAEAREVLDRCEALYRPFEQNPDSADAGEVWDDLGAPWCALAFLLGRREIREDCGEQEPAPAYSTWVIRNSVWPCRCVDSAAKYSSFSSVESSIRSSLLAWCRQVDG